MNLRGEDLRTHLEKAKISTDGLRLSLHSSSLFPLYLVETRDARFALKGMQSRSMALAEAEGLQLLLKSGARTPAVYGPLDTAGGHWLLMEFIETSHIDRRAGKDDLVAGLTRLYSLKQEHWGGASANFIGTQQQPNHMHTDFESFWWTDRIAPMLERAQSSGYLKDLARENLRASLSKLIDQLGLSSETPRIIHGDLWAGNVLFADTFAYLIDPSVGFSSPEQDFAMLDLFGSPLGPSEYRMIARDAEFNLHGEAGTDFFQLYPLMVHVVIFGGAYERQTRALIRRMTGT